MGAGNFRQEFGRRAVVFYGVKKNKKKKKKKSAVEFCFRKKN